MSVSARARIPILLAAAIAMPASAAPQTQQAQVPEHLNALYRSVYELTQSPPPKPRLMHVCEVRADGRYVTFVGVQRHRALIVAFTPGPLDDPSRDISLAPLFVLRHGLPQPIGYDPRVKDATMDWGYIFDRNNDGRVDYLAHLEAPLPVRPAQYPGELPPLLGSITGKALKLAIANTRMVFWHAIDLNFDGASNALVLSMMDRRNGWVDATLLMTKSKHDENGWRCSYFDGSALRGPKPYETRGAEYVVPGKKILGFRKIPPTLDYLKRINAAAARCGLGPGSFYQTPAGVRKALTDAR